MGSEKRRVLREEKGAQRREGCSEKRRVLREGKGAQRRREGCSEKGRVLREGCSEKGVQIGPFQWTGFRTALAFFFSNLDPPLGPLWVA